MKFDSIISTKFNYIVEYYKDENFLEQLEQADHGEKFTELCIHLAKLSEGCTPYNVESRRGDVILTTMRFRKYCGEDVSSPKFVDHLVEQFYLQKGVSLKPVNESTAETKAIQPGLYSVRGRRFCLEEAIYPTEECLGAPVYQLENGFSFIYSEVRKIEEDAPANAVGTGNIAGVSPGQEPPGPKGGFVARAKLKKRKGKAPPQ